MNEWNGWLHCAKKSPGVVLSERHGVSHEMQVASGNGLASSSQKGGTRPTVVVAFTFFAILSLLQYSVNDVPI